MQTKFNKSIGGMQKVTIFFVAFCLSFSLNSIAQSGKVKFAGNWKMNEAKSVLGEGPQRGASKTLAVVQDGTTLSVERVNMGREGKEMKNTSKYTLDGKPGENTTGRGTSTSVATWSADGKVLTITTTAVFERQGQKTEMKSIETWKLDATGKVITIDSNSSSPRGERKLTLVYDKQ